MLLPGVLVYTYLQLASLSIAPLFGINPFGNQFDFILQYGLWASSVGFVLIVFIMIAQLRGIRIVRRRAIAHRCQLCPRCGYSLQSRTDDTQPCPECGQRISRREAVRLWCRFCGR